MRTHEVSARFTSIALVLAICLLIGAGCGQGSASYKNPTKEPGAPISQEKQLTMDDLLYSEYVSEMRISPDGRRLAWVKKGNTRGQDLASSNLFVTNLSDLSTVQLTNLWVSMWGPCEFGDAITRTYFGKDPGLFKYPKTNPFYNAGKVKTPTIMFTGDADVNVPASMTWVTYRGIQQHGKAPVELFIAPGEGHVYERVSHQRRKMVEEQRWFDKYLFQPGK